MGFLKNAGEMARSTIGRAYGKTKTVIATPQAVNYTPVSNLNNEQNRLSTGNPLVTPPIKEAPTQVTLNSTGTAVNTPTPVGQTVSPRVIGTRRDPNFNRRG